MTQSEEKSVVQNVPDLHQKLLKQVEYYFGDANLPRDKFIKEECSKNEGWLPLEILLKFNRLKNLLKTVESNKHIDELAEALQGSSLVDVDESKKKIRRNPEVPLPNDNGEERSVYLKGFSRTETSLDELLEFFGKFDGMEGVIMRYYKEKTIATEPDSDEKEKDDESKAAEEAPNPKIVWVKKFKGSVFVIFKTLENAKVLLEEPNLMYKGTPLIRMTQKDYKSKKLKEYQERIQAKKAKIALQEKEADEDAEESKPMLKGTLLKFANLPENTNRDDLKKKFYAATDETKYEVAYVDMNVDNTKDCIVRLARENAAKEAFEVLKDKKLKLDEDLELAVTLLEGDEEVKYHNQIRIDREKRKRRGGRRGNRGGKRPKRS